MMTNTGLVGVVAAQTQISFINEQENDLLYRGYSVKLLTEYCSFDEIAYLLIMGDLPNKKELDDFVEKVNESRFLPKEIKIMLHSIKTENCSPMDVLKAGISLLSCLEPSNQSEEKICIRIFGILPSILAYWFRLKKYGETLQDNILTSCSSTVEFLLKLVLGNKTWDENIEKCLNVSLILYAEHDLNASTFTSRVIASTKSDIYSCVVGAIGALKGPLHGGANEATMIMLKSFNDIKNAENKLKLMTENKELIMGFGHRIYKNKGDPRSNIIKQQSCILSGLKQENSQLYKLSEFVENWMIKNRNIYPNLDFYSASAYHQCNVPIELYTPLFVISRATGWLAHILEQRKNNKLIRPLAEYTGIKFKNFIPLKKRTAKY